MVARSLIAESLGCFMAPELEGWLRLGVRGSFGTRTNMYVVIN